MREDPTRAGDDELASRLRSGFDALARAAGEPPPLPDRPTVPLPALRPGPSRLLVAAAIVVVALLAGTLAVAVHDGDGPDDRVRAGQGETTTTQPPPVGERKPPPAGDHRLLVCPPELLDLTRLAATPVVATDPGVDGTADSVGPYELTWEQDGATVRLQYPRMFWEVTTVGGDLENHQLGDFDGERSATIYRIRPSIGAVLDGTSGIDGDECDQYGLLVQASGKGAVAKEREVFLAVADAVRLRVPPETVEVPDVTGLGRAEAQDALARVGLVPTWPWTYVTSASAPVSEQQPAAGERVAAGTPVGLTIADADPLVPEVPLACPMGRLQVATEIVEPNTEVPGSSVVGKLDGGTSGLRVRIAWPNWISGSAITPKPAPSDGRRTAHRLTIGGRPALMHDDSLNGPYLVVDTGLPGTCRYLEVDVYNRDVAFDIRSQRAIEIASEQLAIGPPPTDEPPDVVGLPLRAAVDRLSRAGFLADWGDDHGINDEVPMFLPVPTTPTVTGQEVTAPGVVRLGT